MPRRIGLLLFGDLGDTLLTVPAVRAIRSTFPDAHLVVLSKALPAEILTALGLADETLVVDKHLFDRPAALLRPGALVQLFRLYLHIRRERLDTVVLFHHLVTTWGALKFALLSLATGARVRVGIDNGRGWFLTRSIRDRGFGERHESQYFMDVAGLIGASGPLQLEAPVATGDRLEAAT